MTAREYLDQIADLDELIKSKVQEIGRLKDEAKRTSVKLEGERVQSSGSKQKMANTIIKYVHIEQGELQELYEERQEIINTMKKLPYRDYDILFNVYVLGYKLNALPKKYHKSYSWAKQAHKKALNAMQKILDERV
jgi:hypothetical protein